MNKEEITNIVYDTLMENRGKPYVAFDLSKVENQEMNAAEGLIVFDYGDAVVKIVIDLDGWDCRDITENMSADVCDRCRKCGETICGNDTEFHRCFEPI